MELEAPRALAVAEGLVLVLLAAREAHGSVRQVEDVEMPLVDADGLAQVGEQRVGRGLGVGLDASQPTSGSLCWARLRAERARST